MDVPYVHVERTPIALNGALTIPFTPVSGSQACIISRTEDVHNVLAAGHWDHANTTVSGATPIRHENPSDGAGHYYTDTLDSYDTWTWAPPTYTHGTPTTVYINRVTPDAMVAGDTLLAVWGRYDIGASTDYSGFVSKQISELPELTEGLAYGPEVGLTPHITIANTLITNDFADGSTQCSPISVEPKCRVNDSLYVSLREHSDAVNADDSDVADDVIRFATIPSGAPEWPIDGAARKFNNTAPSNPDDDISDWTGATAASAAYAPNTLGGADVTMDGHYRIRHNTNAGTAWYSRGDFDTSTTMGRAARTSSGPTPTEASGYITYNYTRKFYDENDALLLTGYPTIPAWPSTVTGTVTMDPAISGGPAIADNPCMTPSDDGLWSVDIPASTTAPMEHRCRVSFSHYYPWDWQTPGGSFDLHIEVLSAGWLWQFWVVDDGSGETHTDDDLYSIFGLSSDRTIWDQTRIVHNAGFNTAALIYRFSDDNDATWGTAALTGMSGRSPNILCMGDHSAFIVYSDGTNVVIKKINDDGTEAQTMPSSGAGKLVSAHVGRDMVSPFWVACCTASSGTGNLTVTVAHDSYGLTDWGAPVTVVTGVPAQKPSIAGDMSCVQLLYHDASGIVRIKQSNDSGMTWRDG